MRLFPSSCEHFSSTLTSFINLGNNFFSFKMWCAEHMALLIFKICSFNVHTQTIWLILLPFQHFDLKLSVICWCFILFFYSKMMKKNPRLDYLYQCFSVVASTSCHNVWHGTEKSGEKTNQPRNRENKCDDIQFQCAHKTATYYLWWHIIPIYDNRTFKCLY